MDKQLQLKEKIKEQYGKIALEGNSESLLHALLRLLWSI